MINLNEFRIGLRFNYKGSYKYDGVVTEEFAKYIFSVNDEWDLLEPIELTEEWLLKFGFKKNIDGYYELFIKSKNANISAILRKDLKGNKYAHIGIAGAFGLYDTIYYKYVHQLQNLYFDLTNEELELKEKATD